MTMTRVSSKNFVQAGHETRYASSVSKYLFHYIMSLSDLPKLWSMIVSPNLFLSWFQNGAEQAVSDKVSELSSYSDCTPLLMNFEWLEWKFVKTGTEFKKSNTFSLIGDFETSQFYPLDSRPIPCESLGQVTSVITWSTKFSSAVLIKEQHFEVLVEPWERTMGSNYFWIHILKYSHPCFCKRFFFPFHNFDWRHLGIFHWKEGC